MKVAVGKRVRLDSWARVTCGWRGAEDRLDNPHGLSARGGTWEVIAHGACCGQWVLRAERWPDVLILAEPRQLWPARCGDLGAGWRPELARLAVRLTDAPWYYGSHEVMWANRDENEWTTASEFDPQRVVEIRPVNGLCEYRLEDSLGDVWVAEVGLREWRCVPRYVPDDTSRSGVWRLFSTPDNDAMRADADVVRRVIGR